jgi:alkylhydroperoxidase family enzyme
MTKPIRAALAAALAVLAAAAGPVRAEEAGAAPAPAAPEVSRSGIPYLPDDKLGPPDLVDAIRSRRAGGKLLNLDRILLYSPNFAKGWNAQFGAIRNQLSLPPKLRELAIMAIGALNHSEYEWAQHEGEFLKAGGSKQQLAALRKDAAAAARDRKLFDEPERAALALTTEMTRKIAVSPATMKRVRAALPDPQVVELAGTIAGYNMVSRFVVVLGIEVEGPPGAKTSAR